MTLEQSIQAYRLHVLAEAERTGNVSAVYRQFGISRTVFCEWRRAFRHSGRDGVLSKPQTWQWGRPSRVLPEKHGPSPGEGAARRARSVD